MPDRYPPRPADRFLRWAAGAALVLLALFVAQPYLTGFLFSADTARAITARGDLAPAETATVELFARASPSVVHVFVQAAAQGRALMGVDSEGGEPGQRLADRNRLHLGCGRTHRHQQPRGRGGGAGRRLHRGPAVLRRGRVGEPRRRGAELRSRGHAPRAHHRRRCSPWPSAPRPTSRSARRPSPSAIRSASTTP